MDKTPNLGGLRGGLKRKANALDASRFDIRSVAKTYKQVPIELMRPGMFQTRRNFKPRALKELAASLETTGININPLIIRPLKFGEGYEIICGECRWRSAQMCGLSVLLCCIGDFTDDQAMYISGVDNIQREDLNPLEEAHAYELLLHTGMTHEDVSKDIGRSRTHVTNHLRLLQLPLAVRDMLADERLSFAQARPLCGLTAPGIQVGIAREAVAKGWSSKKVGEHVAALQKQVKKPPQRFGAGEDVDIRRLKEVVSEHTGYPCVILRTPSGGWQIGLNASTSEEFQGILERLGVNTDSL
ncbi:ParB/RepB/Spo0J family partition protein [Pseudomonas sp. MWU12-2323]|uniref:ParB/RepB/Spo0J family partition protein n=1 Tax=Pseudomonas sp. MWU12-2323 TaxID=2651296 RepID=UPI00128AE519|nr:ParB/RepB/Spo0J family partition protein [Pseudomonas sp. MWU12-2323]MPQ69271.1 ParB/RepB/Spo0J family partition protein [Pseudomonas sp. MWU12-2323]